MADPVTVPVERILVVTRQQLHEAHIKAAMWEAAYYDLLEKQQKPQE